MQPVTKIQVLWSVSRHPSRRVIVSVKTVWPMDSEDRHHFVRALLCPEQFCDDCVKYMLHPTWKGSPICARFGLKQWKPSGHIRPELWSGRNCWNRKVKLRCCWCQFEGMFLDHWVANARQWDVAGKDSTSKHVPFQTSWGAQVRT